MGLPVAYFAGGEGGSLVETHKLGWNIPVSDFNSFQKFISELSILELERFDKEKVQQKAVETFDFHTQFDKFSKAVNDV